MKHYRPHDKTRYANILTTKRIGLVMTRRVAKTKSSLVRDCIIVTLTFKDLQRLVQSDDGHFLAE
jgi:hypothetical protein